ncbi:gliding motility-associated C-terminal domain-containing protein [Winogradskyella litorisediminis]|uniref:Gliding motility-associated C-terminal domain-containing protein n=1 Tax=Winogradskyella litorisediminis TaxID=1156618 RepID=A0ABW3N826_9FLAO
MKRLLLLFFCLALFNIQSSFGLDKNTDNPQPFVDFTVNCSAGTESTTFCYGNNETETFLFTSSTGAPVIIEFLEGSIESGFDDITIYDGNNNSGTVLFSGDNGGDLAGIIAQSTGDSLFIEVDSDGSVSCQSSTSFTPWTIEFRCVTCIPATANYDIVSDCANGEQFFIEVNLSDVGDAESIEISDNQGSDVVTTSVTGVFAFGPFANGTEIDITVADADDVNCILTSGTLTQAFCPEQSCDIINAGPDQVTGCGSTEEIMLAATFMESSLTNDTSVYNISSLNCPLANLEGTPTALNIDDRWSSVIDIEFDFEFYGITYNQLVVGANGLISFDTGLSGNFCPWSFEPDELIPTPDLPTNAIHGVYHDIDPSVSGQIEYTVVGVAPERQFKVSFVHVPHFSCNELLTTSQIILYESSNVIDVVVAEKPTCQTWNDGLAVIGLQNSSGTTGVTPPGRNTGDWSVTEQELWRFVPSGDANFEFEWFDGNGTSLGNNSDITVNPTETTTYTASITYTDANNVEFTITDDVTVSVLDNSPEAGAVGNLVNCSNAQGNAEFDLTQQDAIIFNGATDLNVIYFETFDDADSGNNPIQNPATYTNTSNPQTVFYRLEFAASPECYSVGNFDLVVEDFDTSLVNFEQGCNGESYEITISPINNSYDPNTVTYEWFGPVGADTSNNTNATFIATVDGEYSVDITTAEGCVYSVSTDVLNANCVFPQGISPNGDAFNNNFDLRAFNVRKLEIFNRNGRSVYIKENYTNEWFGQSSDGELPVGTYFYVAELENNETRNGWIYIQR